MFRFAPLPSVLSVLLLPLLATGCSTVEEGGDTPPQAPVIVVQAPPETKPAAETVDEDYPGLEWQAPKAKGAKAEDNEGDPNDPNTEPYDVVALLREFDPQLTDPPKDQAGDAASDDLLSAFAVMDDKYLYARMVTRVPMTGTSVRETRFWIEQGKKMVTVEVKVGTQDRPCELSDLAQPDVQAVAPGCFWAGNALDLRIPLNQVPATIDLSKPYWVSGFQTCCQDEARNKPFDSIEGAQEVWRVPGLASEVDAK